MKIHNKGMNNNKRIQIILWVVITIISFALVFVLTGVLEAYHGELSTISIVIIALLLIYAYVFDTMQLTYQRLKKVLSELTIRLLLIINKQLNNKIERLNISSRQYSIDLLSPVVDIERHRIYVEQLKKSIDSVDAKNIALTGAYGSGKSSIVKTFLSLYPNYKYINVSLASFVEVNTTRNIDFIGGNNQKPSLDLNFEEQLEYSILQQLFYQVKASKIPSSRFGRIERSSVLSRVIQTVACFILVMSVAVLFLNGILTNNIGVAESLLDNNLVHWSAVILFCISLLYIIFKFVVTLSRISLKSLKVSEATLQLEDKKNVSIMNRYMDEIMYLFQEMKYEIVIFEDIDRFDGTQIFTKLRELNLILNQSDDIKNKVTFVYALRDDIFSSAEQRTKFFDYIVPVIPYVNVSNSADLFRRKFKMLEIPEKDLPVDYITNISAFVDDMRVLTNVVNEFRLYREQLDKKLDLKKLLAVILYKNLYPTDFAKLHQNEGVVYSVFASKPKLKSTRKKEIENKIDQINDRISLVENERLHSVEELRKLVAYAFLQKAYSPGSKFYDKDRTREISLKDLSLESNVELIVKGQAIGYNNSSYYGSKVNVTISDLKSILGENFDYELRKSQIVDKNKTQIRKLQQELQRCFEQLSLLSKTSLLELSKSGVDIFSSIDESLLKGKDFKVLRFLLEHGYIDEEYFLYISLFQEGMLSPDDQRFLMNLKFGERMSVSYKLQEVESLVLNLSEPDYDRIGIVNFDLMNYLFANSDTNSAKCEAIIKQIITNQDCGLDMVFDYLHDGKQQNVFVKYVIRLWPNIWDEIAVDIKHGDEMRDYLLRLAFDVSTLAELKIFCSEKLVSYINKKTDYPSLFSGLNVEHAKHVIDLLCPCLCHIQSNGNNELLKYIVENGYYELNQYNVLLILSTFDNIDSKKYASSIYTSVCLSNLESLKAYVEDEIEDFVRNLVLDSNNVEEHEKAFVTLLNNEVLPMELKRQLIEHNKTKVNAIENVTDDSLRKLMYEYNRTLFNLDNIRFYYQSYNVDDILCAYLNTNADKIVSCVDVDYSLDADDTMMIRNLLLNDKINAKAQCAILENDALFDAHPEDWSELRTEVLMFAISKNMVEYSNELVKSIITKHSSIMANFAAQFADNIVYNITELELALHVIHKLISLPEFALHKDLLMQSVDKTKISSVAEAEFYINYVISNERFPFRPDVFDYAIEKCNNPILKVTAVYSTLSRKVIQPKDLVRYSQSVNEGFSAIANIGDKLKLPNQEPYIKIMNILNEMSVVGKLKIDGDTISAHVRTPRKK